MRQRREQCRAECRSISREKPAEFSAKWREKSVNRNAVGERSYIGSERVRGARGNSSHAHTQLSLTPLIRAAHARLTPAALRKRATHNSAPRNKGRLH